MHINKPARSAQFTPGPWYPHYAKADHCLSSSVWGQEPGNQVAVVGGKSLQTMNANARIIAAAPAMYEALKNILALQLACDGVTVKLTEFHCHQVREAQAALAQAEGRHHE